MDFHGHRRSNETHISRTDPEAKLYRKGPGKPSQLAHLGHVLNENRNGLIMEVCVTEASGTAEREAALAMLDGYQRKHGCQPKTVGADAGYDAGEFLLALEERQIEPHVAMTTTEPANPQTARSDRREKIEARRRMQTRQASAEYAVSQRVRKRLAKDDRRPGPQPLERSLETATISGTKFCGLQSASDGKTATDLITRQKSERPTPS